MNDSPQELEQLAARVEARLRQDEVYTQERQEAYQAKRRSRVMEVIREVVVRRYGHLVPGVVEHLTTCINARLRQGERKV